MKKSFLLLILIVSIAIVDVVAQITYTLKPGSGRTWSNATDWNPKGPPGPLDNVIIASRSGDLNIDVEAECANFTIDPGYTGTITFNSTLGPTSLSISGNWTNSGSPTLGSGQVFLGGNFTNNTATLDVTLLSFTFNGTGDQDIYSASTPADLLSTFGNLTINKPSGTVTLQSDVGVETTFNPTAGTLDQNGWQFYVGGASTPFPVELSSFSAVISNNTIILNWVTATEVNNYGFEVQRLALINEKWIVLGFVEGNGNSNSPKNYTFTDDNLGSSETYSYRLKQIDNDGSYEYSNVIEVDFSLPKGLNLAQNYPNPFNPTTTISFTLSESGNVSLTIFNPLGEEVATLISGYTESGAHTFNFNAENMPSGIYIYQLCSNEKTITKKMLFLK